MTTISIAMATYNGARFIREQLDSLADQTLLPTELVITDDGSTDETLSVIGEFAKTAPFPVRIYSNEHRLGYRSNFMKCVTHCSGEYISFCDQDDIWHKDKLYIIMTEFSKSNKILLVYHNSVAFSQNQDLGLLYKSNHSDSLHFGRLANIGFAPLGFSITFKQLLVRYEDLQRSTSDPNDRSNFEAHDQWYYFIAMSLGEVRYVPRPLVRYRQHEQNVYGWGQRNILLRLFTNLAASSTRQIYLCSCAYRRSQILLRIRSRIDVDVISAVDNSIELYRQLRFLMKLRNLVYNSSTISRRMGAMYRLMQQGSYFPRSGKLNFGFRAALKDALIGVPFGKLAGKST